MNNRREFIKKAAKIGIGSQFIFNTPFELIANNRSKISSNDKINFGVIGCKGMGWSDMRSILKNRARKIFKYQTNKRVKELGITIVDTYVEAGSGSLPENKIRSAALAFSPRKRKVKELAHSFRCGSTPVVGYVNGNVFFIDLKAVLPSQIGILSKIIQEV